MARTCATIVNSNAFRSGPPIQESTFLPKFDGEEEVGQSVAEMKTVAQRIAQLNSNRDEEL